VEVHGVGLRPEVGKPEMSSDFSACGLCLDHEQTGSNPITGKARLGGVSIVYVTRP